MSDDDQRRAQEGLTESAGSASTALDDLTAAARRADETFASGILSVPRTLGDTIARVAGDSLASPVRFFEARFQTLRQLTDFGINFNYSMQSMETAVNNARMDLSQFAGMVSQNSEIMGLFGENVNSGATNFLNSMSQAFDLVQANGQTIENNLARLGYTTDEITETFLNYQQQMVFSGVRNRRDQAAINRSAAEFAENLDDLSVLTGKRRDQLAEEMLEVSRRGDIMARARQLPENIRQTLGETVGEFEQQFGPLMGGLVSDILGPGFAQGRSVAVQAANEEFANTIYRMRSAFERGDEAEVERLRRLAESQASRFLDSDEFVNMGVFRGTEFGDTMAQLGEEMAQSAYFVRQNIRDRLEQDRGRAVTDAEVDEELRRMQEERRAQAQGQAETAYQQFVDNTIALEKAAQTARRTAIDGAYTYLEGTVQSVGRLFEGLVTRLTGDATRQVDTFGAVADRLLAFIPSGSAADTQTEIDRAASLGTSGAEIAGQMGAIAEEMAGASGARLTELQSQFRELVERSRQIEARTIAINTENAEINLTDQDRDRLMRLFGVDGSTPEGTTPDQGGSIGTIGRFGRLFNNFGSESLVPLHNIESIMTPAQMGDLVERSASGMARAIVSQIDNVSSDRAVSAIMRTSFDTQDQLRVLQGNLNSVMRNVTTASASGTTSEINLDGLESEIRQIAARMKGPLEEALTSSLRPHLEQIVSYSRTTAETNTRIQRNIRGVVGDYTRG